MRKMMLLLPLFVAACSSAPLPPDQLFQATVIPPKQAGEAYSLVRMAGFVPFSSAEENRTRWQITGIALSDDYLFLASPGNGVYRLPKYGGRVDVVESSSAAQTSWVLVSGKRVYWDHRTLGSGSAPDHRLEGRDASGGPIATVANASYHTFDTNTFIENQVDANYLYYVKSEDAFPPPLALERVPLGGGAPVTLKSFSAGTVSSQNLGIDYLADGGDVFLIDGNTLDVLAGDGTEKKLADLPATPNGAWLTAVAADVNSVYLVGNNSIFTVSRLTGDVKTIYTTPDENSEIFWGLLVDANSVYFVTVDNRGWAVLSMPKAGGPTTRLTRASAQFDGGLFTMLQDDKNLFVQHAWEEILMVPKTPTGKFQ